METKTNKIPLIKTKAKLLKEKKQTIFDLSVLVWLHEF